MLIGALAKLAGTDAETIRYYEREGLLPAAARLPNGYRAYGAFHLERLTFIRHCRALDMSLADIGRLLGFVDDPDSDCEGINELVDDQIDRVQARLASLAALKRQLVALRKRCDVAHRPARDCGILDELISAARGDACACHLVPALGPELRPASKRR